MHQNVGERSFHVFFQLVARLAAGGRRGRTQGGVVEPPTGSRRLLLYSLNHYYLLGVSPPRA